MWTALTIVVFSDHPKAEANVSSIAAATAGSGRASIEMADTPFLNPAALPYKPGYFFGSGLSRFRSEGLGDIDVFTVSATDNMPETVVPTTLGFASSKYLVGNVSWDRRDIRLAVANFFNKNHALGMGLSYRQSRSEGINAQQGNLFVGSLFSVTKELSVGAVFENFVPAPKGIPDQEKLMPSIGLAAGYNYRTFLRLKLDLLSASNNSWDKPVLATGFEFYWNKWLIGRMGYSRNNELGHNLYSVGAGFAGPVFGIHYALQTHESTQGWDQRHSIDLGIPVW